MDVTRYATGDGRGESRDPYRTDPNLTGPTAFELSPDIHSSSSVMGEAASGQRRTSGDGWMGMKP